jgi:hypothetical protein
MSEHNDPIRDLESFGTGGITMTPIPPSEVRRLGNRRRTRRRAAYTVVAAAAVVAAIVPVAVLGGRNDAAPPQPLPSVGPTSTPTTTPATVITFPGVGVEVKAVSDTSKLEGTTDEFKTFIAGVWQQNTADCPTPDITVKKYSSAGFALGGVGGCGGYVALWTVRAGAWKEALGTQDEWTCGDLTRFSVPDGFAGDCLGPKAVLGPESDAGLRLGMSMDEVKAAGGTVSPAASAGGDYCRTVNPKGLPDTTAADGSTSTVGYLSLQPDRGVVALFAQKDQVTSRGIRVGDLLYIFKKAYPEATKTGFGWYRVDIDDRSHYRFDFDRGGVIQNISLELDGPQGCYE